MNQYHRGLGNGAHQGDRSAQGAGLAQVASWPRGLNLTADEAPPALTLPASTVPIDPAPMTAMRRNALPGSLSARFAQ
ncbi:hypothetical protein [Pseudooceanicola sp.]|uniref:hypothetical protein n=1 Tax=Pseudooceanicola sp. TaxID=1914328 RepID=UPI0026088169|nr:hypothetical protein [Pseudooceanicola sp.]MDF1854795.1 hypothetical protein [Pseudooceanicola sp.]